MVIIVKSRFEAHILNLLTIFEDSRVKEAVQYSFAAPGKRIRPMMLLGLVEDFGKSPYNGMDSAAALEMIHCYSLIHDDLPAMDNDDLRRGLPTSHKKFDEATAILAGDALLTAAFEVVTASNIQDDKKVKIIRILARSAGLNGMILGQTLDMQYEQVETVSFDQLVQMYALKTGALISAALEIACVLAEREDVLEQAKQLGLDIGIAFQIQDDILDATKSSEQIGKTASDLENHKSTAVKLLGLKEAQLYVEKLFQSIKKNLDQLNLSGQQVEGLIEYLINRER